MKFCSVGPVNAKEILQSHSDFEYVYSDWYTSVEKYRDSLDSNSRKERVLD